MKLIKAAFFWATFVILYFICAKYNFSSEFKSVLAALVVAAVSRIVITERYDSLMHKDEILRGLYDLVGILQTKSADGKEIYWAEKYPIVDKAIENVGIFCDDKIVQTIYGIEEAIATKNVHLIAKLDRKSLLTHLHEIHAKKTLGNFLLNEIIMQIIINTPGQFCNAAASRIKGAFQFRNPQLALSDQQS